MKRLWIDMLLFLAAAAIVTLIGLRFYYSAVYATCVHMSAVNGQVTSFDLIQCHNMEKRARADGWMFKEMP